MWRLLVCAAVAFARPLREIADAYVSRRQLMSGGVRSRAEQLARLENRELDKAWSWDQQVHFVDEWVEHDALGQYAGNLLTYMRSLPVLTENRVLELVTTMKDAGLRMPTQSPFFAHEARFSTEKAQELLYRVADTVPSLHLQRNESGTTVHFTPKRLAQSRLPAQQPVQVGHIPAKQGYAQTRLSFKQSSAPANLLESFFRHTDRVAENNVSHPLVPRSARKYAPDDDRAYRVVETASVQHLTGGELQTLTEAEIRRHFNEKRQEAATWRGIEGLPTSITEQKALQALGRTRGTATILAKQGTNALNEPEWNETFVSPTSKGSYIPLPGAMDTTTYSNLVFCTEADAHDPRKLQCWCRDIENNYGLETRTFRKQAWKDMCAPIFCPLIYSTDNVDLYPRVSTTIREWTMEVCDEFEEVEEQSNRLSPHSFFDDGTGSRYGTTGGKAGFRNFGETNVPFTDDKFLRDWQLVPQNSFQQMMVLLRREATLMTRGSEEGNMFQLIGPIKDIIDSRVLGFLMFVYARNYARVVTDSAEAAAIRDQADELVRRASRLHNDRFELPHNLTQFVAADSFTRLECEPVDPDVVERMKSWAFRRDPHFFRSAVVAFLRFFECMARAFGTTGIDKAVGCVEQQFSGFDHDAAMGALLKTKEMARKYKRIRRALAHMRPEPMPERMICNDAVDCCVYDASVDCCDAVANDTIALTCSTTFQPCICELGRDGFVANEFQWSLSLAEMQMRLYVFIEEEMTSIAAHISDVAAEMTTRTERMQQCVKDIPGEPFSQDDPSLAPDQDSVFDNLALGQSPDLGLPGLRDHMCEYWLWKAKYKFHAVLEYASGTDSILHPVEITEEDAPLLLGGAYTRHLHRFVPDHSDVDHTGEEMWIWGSGDDSFVDNNRITFGWAVGRIGLRPSVLKLPLNQQDVEHMFSDIVQRADRANGFDRESTYVLNLDWVLMPFVTSDGTFHSTDGSHYWDNVIDGNQHVSVPSYSNNNHCWRSANDCGDASSQRIFRGTQERNMIEHVDPYTRFCRRDKQFTCEGDSSSGIRTRLTVAALVPYEEAKSSLSDQRYKLLIATFESSKSRWVRKDWCYRSNVRYNHGLEVISSSSDRVEGFCRATGFFPTLLTDCNFNDAFSVFSGGSSHHVTSYCVRALTDGCPSLSYQTVGPVRAPEDDWTSLQGCSDPFGDFDGCMPYRIRYRDLPSMFGRTTPELDDMKNIFSTFGSNHRLWWPCESTGGGAECNPGRLSYMVERAIRSGTPVTDEHLAVDTAGRITVSVKVPSCELPDTDDVRYQFTDRLRRQFPEHLWGSSFKPSKKLFKEKMKEMNVLAEQTHIAKSLESGREFCAPPPGADCNTTRPCAPGMRCDFIRGRCVYVGWKDEAAKMGRFGFGSVARAYLPVDAKLSQSTLDALATQIGEVDMPEETGGFGGKQKFKARDWTLSSIHVTESSDWYASNPDYFLQQSNRSMPSNELYESFRDNVNELSGHVVEMDMDRWFGWKIKDMVGGKSQNKVRANVHVQERDSHAVQPDNDKTVLEIAFNHMELHYRLADFTDYFDASSQEVVETSSSEDDDDDVDAGDEPPPSNATIDLDTSQYLRTVATSEEFAPMECLVLSKYLGEKYNKPWQDSIAVNEDRIDNLHVRESYTARMYGWLDLASMTAEERDWYKVPDFEDCLEEKRPTVQVPDFRLFPSHYTDDLQSQLWQDHRCVGDVPGLVQDGSSFKVSETCPEVTSGGHRYPICHWYELLRFLHVDENTKKQMIHNGWTALPRYHLEFTDHEWTQHDFQESNWQECKHRHAQGLLLYGTGQNIDSDSCDVSDHELCCCPHSGEDFAPNCSLLSPYSSPYRTGDGYRTRLETGTRNYGANIPVDTGQIYPIHIGNGRLEKHNQFGGDSSLFPLESDATVAHERSDANDRNGYGVVTIENPTTNDYRFTTVEQFFQVSTVRRWVNPCANASERYDSSGPAPIPWPEWRVTVDPECLTYFEWRNEGTRRHKNNVWTNRVPRPLFPAFFEHDPNSCRVSDTVDDMLVVPQCLLPNCWQDHALDVWGFDDEDTYKTTTTRHEFVWKYGYTESELQELGFDPATFNETTPANVPPRLLLGATMEYLVTSEVERLVIQDPYCEESDAVLIYKYGIPDVCRQYGPAPVKEEIPARCVDSRFELVDGLCQRNCPSFANATTGTMQCDAEAPSSCAVDAAQDRCLRKDGDVQAAQILYNCTTPSFQLHWDEGESPECVSDAPVQGSDATTEVITERELRPGIGCRWALCSLHGSEGWPHNCTLLPVDWMVGDSTAPPGFSHEPTGPPGKQAHTGACLMDIAREELESFEESRWNNGTTWERLESLTMEFYGLQFITRNLFDSSIDQCLSEACHDFVFDEAKARKDDPHTTASDILKGDIDSSYCKSDAFVDVLELDVPHERFIPDGFETADRAGFPSECYNLDLSPPWEDIECEFNALGVENAQGEYKEFSDCLE